MQNALWRLIHDSDYRSRGIARWTRRAFANLDPAQRTARLEFGIRGRTAGKCGGSRVQVRQPRRQPPKFSLTMPPTSAPARGNAFSDWLAYDSEAQQGGPWKLVGDLKLQFIYERKAGDGPLRLMLTKRGKTFMAEIDRDHGAPACRRGLGLTRELIPATAFPQRSAAMSIEYSNVDYQVTLRINDRDVLQTTPAQYAPDLQDLLNSSNPGPAPIVRISARNSRRLSRTSASGEISTI